MKHLPLNLILIFIISLMMIACDEIPLDIENESGNVSQPRVEPDRNTENSPPTNVDLDLEEAKVVKVVDGDTIDVLLNGTEYRIRYILVNTPETKHPTKGVEPFGPEAFEVNKQLVAGQTVMLEKDVSDTDQYGRLLRYVYVGDMMINEELLRRGMAQVSTFPPDVKYVDRFLAIQQDAQANQMGMWAQMGQVEIIMVNVRDEYVDLKNNSQTTLNLNGWELVSERGNQICQLGGQLAAGETVRVWSMAADAGPNDYDCGFDQGIWSNSAPDPASLYNAEGLKVDDLDAN